MCDLYETQITTIDCITHVLDKNLTYYEPFPGSGNFAENLIQLGYNIVFNLDSDFFEDFNKGMLPKFDAILTNPPFSKKRQFIDILYSCKFKFIILLPVNSIPFFSCFYKNDVVDTHMEKLRFIIPRKRIEYLLDGKVCKKPNFSSMWIINIV